MQTTYTWLWKFLAAMAASVAFVISVMLSVKLIVVVGTGDVSIPIADNFWAAFDFEKFARLIFGMSLAAIAITLTVEFMFSRLGISFKNFWLQNTAAYFTATFVVIVASSIKLFSGPFASNPGTMFVTFLFVTLCSFLAATIYGLVCLAAPRSTRA